MVINHPKKGTVEFKRIWQYMDLTARLQGQIFTAPILVTTQPIYRVETLNN